MAMETNIADSTDHDGASGDQEHVVGDLCAGCVELSQRVDRLEQLVEQLRNPEYDAQFSTTRCYWLCLGIHAFFLFSCATNEFTLSAVYGLLLGSAATLAIIHAWADRSFVVKLGRSITSISVVMGSFLLGMRLAGLDELSEYFPLLLVVVPSCVLPAVLAAKIFVWAGGWQIKVPNQAERGRGFQIRDLMILTLAVAVYLGLVRVFLMGEDSTWDSDYWYMIGYASLAVFLGTLFTAPIARVLLRPERIRFRSIMIPYGIVTCIVAMFYMLAAGGADEFTFQVVFMVLMFVAIAMLSVFISPLFTFYMMRLACYRFQRRVKTGGESPIPSPPVEPSGA